MTFLAFFYTDVYKIPAGTASVIIFVGGFFGAFFNIIMGAIADRTNTRWGKIQALDIMDISSLWHNSHARIFHT